MKGDLPERIRKALRKRVLIEWKHRPEILTSPNIPQPMHGLAPRTILGENWWNRTRRACYKSTNFHCIACGVHKYQARNRQWLEGHEVYDIDYLLGRMTFVEVVPLCTFCHNYIHDGRLRWLLETGKVHHAKYAAIIQHGDKVLREAGLIRETYNGPTADWEDWRLVIDGAEYEPLYKSFEDWRREFGQ